MDKKEKEKIQAFTNSKKVKKRIKGEPPKTKRTSLAKKLDLVLDKVGKIDDIERSLKENREKIGKLEQVYNRSVIKEQDSETLDKTQTKTDEQKLEELQRQQGQGQGQQPTQESYQKLSNKDKVKFWEEQAQQQAQAQQQGTPSIFDNAVRIINAITPAVVAGIESRSLPKMDEGKKGEKKAPIEQSVDSLNKQLDPVIKLVGTLFGSAQTLINATQQNAFGNALGFLKLMTPGERTQAMQNISQPGQEQVQGIPPPIVPGNKRNIRIIEE